MVKVIIFQLYINFANYGCIFVILALVQKVKKQMLIIFGVAGKTVHFILAQLFL